jgi:F-type H+-transporting ATPase subunit a
MPEHTSWFTYLVSLPAIRHYEEALDRYPTYPAGTPVTLEFTAMMVFVIALVLLVALVVRARVSRTKEALVPEGRLTLTSFVENFVEVFYGTLKNTVGAKDAKHFLPLIGTCAVFIFFSNALALIPGFAAATSNFNVTFACGIVIFFATHYYGFKRTGVAYLKHFVGPFWWLAWLIGPVEVISNLIRPATLGLRLAMNMYLDHLLVGAFTNLIAILVPVAIMTIGVVVILVQTYVFCLLSTIYISLAIEHHEEHHGADPHHGHGHGDDPRRGDPLEGMTSAAPIP